MIVRRRRAAPVIVAAGVFKFGDSGSSPEVIGNEKMVTVRPPQPQIAGLRAIARLFVGAGNSFATKRLTRHLETTFLPELAIAKAVAGENPACRSQGRSLMGH
jgi:hypothetical protein